VDERALDAAARIAVDNGDDDAPALEDRLERDRPSRCGRCGRCGGCGSRAAAGRPIPTSGQQSGDRQ
jgi:hypothetical protein